MATKDTRQTILAVDRNRRNLELLAQFLDRAGYETCKVGSLEDLDSVLSGPGAFPLALVDLSGFDRNIWERCETLRQRCIPFLLISPRQSAALQQEGIVHGARGVLVKPLRVDELLGLISRLLSE